MRQRAALLRTVLLDRPILLLDEPFGALDALTRAALQEWLLGIWERLKAAVLFVTHDVEEALWLSDRVYVMTRRPGSIQLDLPVGLTQAPDARMCVARWSSRRSSNACWTHCWLTLLSFKIGIMAGTRTDGGGAMEPNPLIGAWRLVTYEAHSGDEISYPLGEDASGYIMYTPDGYMSVLIMAGGPGKLRVGRHFGWLRRRKAGGGKHFHRLLRSV